MGSVGEALFRRKGDLAGVTLSHAAQSLLETRNEVCAAEHFRHLLSIVILETGSAGEAEILPADDGAVEHRAVSQPAEVADQEEIALAHGILESPPPAPIQGYGDGGQIPMGRL